MFRWPSTIGWNRGIIWFGRSTWMNIVSGMARRYCYCFPSLPLIIIFIVVLPSFHFRETMWSSNDDSSNSVYCTWSCLAVKWRNLLHSQVLFFSTTFKTNHSSSKANCRVICFLMKFDALIYVFITVLLFTGSWSFNSHSLWILIL